jgi:hypothetical protein
MRIISGLTIPKIGGIDPIMASIVKADEVEAYCRQVRERSREHREAMAAAAEHHWRSVALGILRQEIDSMVRTMFIASQCDHERARLLHQAVSSSSPLTRLDRRGREIRIPDKVMVEHAQALHGWTNRVYEFGCSFIHLSSRHDYNARDPFQACHPTNATS